MNDNNIDFKPIGIIHSPHKILNEIPIQPVFAENIEGTVELYPEFIEGLKSLDQFSHIFLFYHFHKSQKTMLELAPYLSKEKHGIFATRAPHRPNKLGMSLVRLVDIKENILYLKDIDILDGTPLIDIKPYINRFDSRKTTSSGWQDDVSDDVASVSGLRDYKKDK